MSESEKELRVAVLRLLPFLDVEGTCQVCEQSFKFHTVWCPLHEVFLALTVSERNAEPLPEGET